MSNFTEHILISLEAQAIEDEHTREAENDPIATWIPAQLHHSGKTSYVVDRLFLRGSL